MSHMRTTILKVSIHRAKENANFGEGATHIEVDDEGGGGFVILSQPSNERVYDGTLRFDLDELKEIAIQAEILLNYYNIKL